MKVAGIVLFVGCLLVSCRSFAEQASDAYCNVDTYFRALDIVFGQGGDGERVATVEVLPSFQRESAIVFDMTSSGLVVSRITFQKQLWSQLGLGDSGPRKTASQCINAAKAASVERSTLALPRESAQRFVDDLAKMHFVADQCPRYKDGTCAYIEDGVDYVVQYEDGPPIRLTDVSAFSGMKSENPALSNWVAELLKAVGPSPPSN